jgi:hypothetical protein
VERRPACRSGSLDRTAGPAPVRRTPPGGGGVSRRVHALVTRHFRSRTHELVSPWEASRGASSGPRRRTPHAGPRRGLPHAPAGTQRPTGIGHRGRWGSRADRDMATRPDGACVSLFWRAWGVTPDGQLTRCFRTATEQCWAASGWENIARCNLRGRHTVPAPAPDCFCGWHVLTTEAAVWAFVRSRHRGSPWAVGPVRWTGLGTVLPSNVRNDPPETRRVGSRSRRRAAGPERERASVRRGAGRPVRGSRHCGLGAVGDAHTERGREVTAWESRSRSWSRRSRSSRRGNRAVVV